MPSLTFEIWRDDATDEQSMFRVHPQNDKVRRATMRDAVLVHSFQATSDFAAFQKNYDWNGWGEWKPEPHWTEQPFTEKEAVAQARYLYSRDVR